MLAIELRSAGERVCQTLLEFAAIDEPGEHILTRLVQQLCGVSALARDILQHEHGAGDAARSVANRSDRNVHRQMLAGRTHEHRVAAER